MAQADIDEINAWQEAEAVRLREEAARRIVVRGQGGARRVTWSATPRSSTRRSTRSRVRSPTYQPRTRRVLRQADVRVRSRRDRPDGRRGFPPPPDLAKVGGEARAQALAAVAAEGESTAAEGDHASASADGVAVADDATGTADASAEAAPTDESPKADRAPVPVMAPKNGAGASADGGTSAGPDKTKSAIRILRSIATLATPSADAAKAANGGNGHDAASAEDAEKPVPVTTPVDDIAVPTEPATDPVEAAKD